MEERWAVEVSYWVGSRRVENPFLAGRYYFDRHDGVDRHTRDDVPPTATFDTREAARIRCRMIRGGPKHWRVTARPVKVTVVVRRVS